MYIFIGMAALTLSLFGFDVYSLVLLAVLTISLPAYEYENDILRQVTGYFGLTSSWQAT